MRIPFSVFAVAGVTLIAGAVALMSEPQETPFSIYEKAHYAGPNTVAFVRPGLKYSIVSAKIATGGTITVDYKITDPAGMPLDRLGVQTPGAVSASFLAAYIPKGQAPFWSYQSRA